MFEAICDIEPGMELLKNVRDSEDNRSDKGSGEFAVAHAQLYNFNYFIMFIQDYNNANIKKC